MKDTLLCWAVCNVILIEQRKKNVAPYIAAGKHTNDTKKTEHGKNLMNKIQFCEKKNIIFLFKKNFHFFYAKVIELQMNYLHFK